MKHVRKRLTYANVMSSLAVFLVLGGATAFAATKIGSNEIKANAITTGKIKKEAVTEGKIKGGAVGTSRLANASVTADKLAPSSVTGTAIAPGAVTATKIGPNAVTGPALGDNSVTAPKIAAGSVGAGKLGSIVRVIGESASANTAGELRSATVDCPPGFVAISGSAAWETTEGNASTLAGVLRLSRPIPSGAGSGAPTGWEATGEQTAAFTRVLRVYAICLSN